MKQFGIMVCLLTAAAVTACGSGSSEPQAQPANTGAPVVSPTPEPEHSGGYLFGKLYLNDATSPEYPIQVILSEDGRFRAQQISPYGFPQTWLALRGSFEMHGRAIDGEGIAIANPGDTWLDGESTTGLSISGTLDRPTTTDRGKLLVTVSMASGDSGRIEATFAMLSPYYYGSDLPRLEGSWFAQMGDNGSWYPDPYGSADPLLPPPGFVQLVVNADGAFSGTDDSGCVMDGQFSLIDTRFSLWGIEYIVSECEREGVFSGLALGDNGWYSTRSLTFVADDGSRTQALEFWINGI